MKKKILIGVAVLFISGAMGHSEIVGKDVSYEGDGIKMEGYLAYDDTVEGKRPGILVVHEWWGHNDYARKRADMLAEMGYIALAVDMYGDGKTAEHPQDAGKFSGEVMANMDGAEARFQAAMKLLEEQPQTDPDKIGAIGYCFGGAVVLQMARQGVDLKGVASFHGSLGTPRPAEAGGVKAAILVCHGAADEFISDEQIAGFKEEMESAGADMKFVEYPGAKHGFTNPAADGKAAEFGIPLGYDQGADDASWAEMKAFFDKVFAD
ncbi:MAG: dienelactone hydrolase family protein [Verrucomicrobiota bacterium]